MLARLKEFHSTLFEKRRIMGLNWWRCIQDVKICILPLQTKSGNVKLKIKYLILYYMMDFILFKVYYSKSLNSFNLLYDHPD